MTIMELDNYFRIGFRRITGSSTDDRVQTFLERDALAIDSIMPAGGFINENSHPGAQGLTSENDPTLRAVFISSFVGKSEPLVVVVVLFTSSLLSVRHEYIIHI